MQLSDAARTLKPWSMSKAALARNCPFSFQLKYLKRIREIAPPRSPGSRIGKAVHRMLESFLQGIPEGALQQTLLGISMREKLTSVETEEAMSYLHNIRMFTEKVQAYKQKHSISEEFIEHKFSFTDDLQATPYNDKSELFKGIWDLAFKTPDNYVIIIDHKSGEKLDLPQVQEKYGHQHKLYAVGAMTKFPDLSGVQMAFNFIQKDHIVWLPMISRVTIENDLVPWFVSYLNGSAEQAQTDRAIKSWLCSFCGYMPACPLNMQHPITKGEDQS
jgi:ATP-dependent exoDNAse (exonuclease V) beta subunit